MLAVRKEVVAQRKAAIASAGANRTFEVRAYPTEKIPELRPGMSAYLQWGGGR
jgi:HlyD family secretion protein